MHISDYLAEYKIKNQNTKDVMTQIGKIFMISGIVLFLLGALFYFIGPRMHWLGHLPGDIRIDKPHFKFYFPITTLLLISIVISLLIHLLRRFF